MASRIKGITIEIDGNATKLQTALKGVNASLRESQTALNDVNRLLKVDPGNTELLKQKQDLLNRAIADTKDKLNQEKDALEKLKNSDGAEKNKEQMQALEREIEATTQSLKKLENEYKTFGSVGAQQIANVGAKWQTVGNQISTAGKNVMTTGAVITGAEAAIAAAGKGAFDFAGSIADVGDAIDKNSQKLGVSAEFYQEWDTVLQHSGSSMDSMKTTFKTLATVTSNTTKKQQEALDKLGLKAEDFGGSSEKAFTMVVGALQKMPEGTERAAIAQALLGKGAVEMGALFNTSAEDTQAMIDKLHELGGVMSDDAVKNSATFKDEMQDMQAAMAGVGMEMGAELMPTLIELMQEITAFVKENKDDIVAFLKEVTTGISELIQQFREMSPEQQEAALQIAATIAAIGPLITVIGGLITALGGVVSAVGTIMQYAPAISSAMSAVGSAISTAWGAVVTVFEGIAAACGVAVGVVVAAFALVVAAIAVWVKNWEDIKAMFTDGIPYVFNMFVDKVKNMVTQVGNWFRQMGQNVVTAWRNMVTTVTGIVNSWKATITTAIVGIVNAVKEKFTTLIEDAKQWGIDLVKNIAEGIKESIGLVKDGAEALASKIAEYVHFTEPDVGPLSNFHTFMPDMIDEMVRGINANINLLDAPMNNLANKLVPDNAVELSYSPRLEGQMTSLASAINSINAGSNVRVVLEGDAKALFKAYTTEQANQRIRYGRA